MHKEDANKKQIAGDHYKSEYQHWDFVIATKMHYLAGCATKYLARHRKKNGKQDIEKSRHYVEKLIETKIKAIDHCNVTLVESNLRLFKEANGLKGYEFLAIDAIVKNNYTLALEFIDYIIEEYSKPHEDNTGMEHPFGFNAEEETCSGNS